MAICGLRSFRAFAHVIRVLLLLAFILVTTASIMGVVEISPEVTDNEIEIDGQRTKEIIYGTLSVKSTALLGSGFGLGCVSWGLSQVLAKIARKRTDNYYSWRSDYTSDRSSMEAEMKRTWVISPLLLFFMMGALYGSYLLTAYFFPLSFLDINPVNDKCGAAFGGIILSIFATGGLGFFMMYYAFQSTNFLGEKYERFYRHEEPQENSPNYERAQVNLGAQQPRLQRNAESPEMFEPSRSDSPWKSDDDICAVCHYKKRPIHQLWKFRCNHTYHEPCYNCVTREDGAESKCPECRTIGPAGPVPKEPQPSAPPLSPSVSVAPVGAVPVGAEVVQID